MVLMVLIYLRVIKNMPTCDADFPGCYKCSKSQCKSCKSDFYREDGECYFRKNSNPYCQK